MSLVSLRGLAIPVGDEATVAAIYAKFDGVIGIRTAVSAASRRDDRTNVVAASMLLSAATSRLLGAATVDANASAIAYGLTVCEAG